MTNSEQTYRFYNQSDGYLRRLEGAGWRPEYGAVLGAVHRFMPQASGRALDYGCGVGDLAAALAGAGFTAVGADISVPFVDSAAARFPHLSFVALDSGPRLPFPDGHFAAVTAVNTIEHVARPALALKEMARLLRPGGLLVMTFPNLLTPLRPLKPFLARQRRPKYGPESGDSPSESLRLLARNVSLLANISLSHRTQFRPRLPDFANAERYRVLGYGADYDAVWLCNPADITWRLRELGMRVLEVRGIPGAAERSRIVNGLRQVLPAVLTSPILLVARQPGQ
ncbi:MAG: methyltransferase domain-containing protein [Anaerolineae bacterium]